jgi:monovalent cation/hydrogen antiporter
VLGAVVSTTDAIAATSIARRVGLHQNIVDLLEGESLVNDASGLLALEFAVAVMVTGHTPSPAQGVLRLLYLVIGGLGAGLMIGKLVDLLERHIDYSPIEITISLVTPYLAYLAAESIRSSGVLSAVACGLYLGRRSATYFSSVVRIEAWAFWNTLTYILNGVVFILIGLQLPHILGRIENLSPSALILRGALFSTVLILLRFIWVFPGARASYFIRRRFLGQQESTPPAGGIFIVAWTGMRGVVALAAALSLPATVANGTPFPHRDMIVFLTFCAIFVTLVLQGITLPSLIRRLGMAGQPLAKCEAMEARRIMIEAAIRELENSDDRRSPEMSGVYDDVASHYRARLTSLDEVEREEKATSQELRFEELSRRLRNVEREAAIELRDQDRISDEVLRGLLRELDLMDARNVSQRD